MKIKIEGRLWAVGELCGIYTVQTRGNELEPWIVREQYSSLDNAFLDLMNVFPKRSSPLVIPKNLDFTLAKVIVKTDRWRIVLINDTYYVQTKPKKSTNWNSLAVEIKRACSTIEDAVMCVGGLLATKLL